MRIAPLSINNTFSNRYKKSPELTELLNKQRVRIEVQEIPNDVVIRYEQWPDGYFYPQTAGQFRNQQKHLSDAIMILAKENASF